MNHPIRTQERVPFTRWEDEGVTVAATPMMVWAPMSVRYVHGFVVYEDVITQAVAAMNPTVDPRVYTGRCHEDNRRFPPPGTEYTGRVIQDTEEREMDEEMGEYANPDTFDVYVPWPSDANRAMRGI